jgi:hypothetical protein
MQMRWSWALVMVVAAPAAADTFGGFSGVDRPYLVNQDRVCEPLAVADGKATGMPRCDKKDADVVAALRVKPVVEQRGSKASFVAAAEGTTLKVSRKDADEPLVAWDAPDPIVKVTAVYASQYEDRVAVAYTVRRLGREVSDVVAFELVKTTGRDAPPAPTTSAPPTSATAAAASADDPRIAKAVDAAKKAAKAKQLAAWKDVLAIDAQHGEALYRIAQAQASAKASADAIATLEQLAHSARADAIEFLVEARFDAAFAALRADPKYRTAVGLDRKAQGAYERVMGLGGHWEQSGTSCERAQVELVLKRDRSFSIRIATACEGVSELARKGTWRIDGDRVILTIPTKGQKVTAKDEAPCSLEATGDEDAMHCSLGHDLDFTVLPTRR